MGPGAVEGRQKGAWACILTGPFGCRHCGDAVILWALPCEGVSALSSLCQLPTPSLLVDKPRMQANVRRLNERLAGLGVPLRPHLKTCKNIEIARGMLSGHPGGATVSTLAEADYFFAHGISDLLYAVGIAPGKLDGVAERMERGMDLSLILDHPDAARAVAKAADRWGVRFRVLLEVDADGHRAGFQPDDAGLVESAKILDAAGCEAAGTMVHAGGSYACRDTACIERVAEDERAAAVGAAEHLREAGFKAPVVSVGSTPTLSFARDLTGVTEARAGVHVFQDLVMAGLGVCSVEDIALSVLTEVIGHKRPEGHLVVDAGWMALSRDRGTAGQAVDQGYGVVCDEAGHVMKGLIVQATNQEHGIIAPREGGMLDPERFPIGTRLRVLPNHACATGGQHGHFRMLDEYGQVSEKLERCSGW